MSEWKFAAIFFSLLVMTGSSVQAAESPILTCQGCYEGQLRSLSDRIDSLNDLAGRYRWIEKEIRHLYYHELWSARRDMSHPTDAVIRTNGAALEARALTEIRDAEKRAAATDGQFWLELRELKVLDRQVSQCCSHRSDFQNCIYQRFAPAYETVEEIEKLWTSMVRAEGDDRMRIAKTAGGLKGDYLDEILESEKEHQELYWRYEIEAAPGRFERDELFRDKLLTLRREVSGGFVKPDCCELCAL